MRKPGIFFHKGSLDTRIRGLLKGTFCEGWDVISDLDDLKKVIEKFQPEEKPYTIIDHFFNVKGVGNVLLGCLKGGEVKAYDKTMIYPQKKEVMIKSIQVHDKSFKEVSGFSRVGYSVKGISLEEVERGSIITDKDILVLSEAGKIDFNKFSKPLEKGETAMACFGAQVRTISLDGNKTIMNKPTALYTHGIVFRNDIKDRLRIIGSILVEKPNIYNT
jgi:selenocysteine-specific translation elongation factor